MTIQFNAKKWESGDVDRVPDRERKFRGYRGWAALDEEGRYVLRVKVRLSDNPNGAVAHAQVWLDGYAMGYGRARGYGYDKVSASLDSALESMGIRCTRMQCEADIVEALEAICEKVGRPCKHLVEFSF